MIKLILTSIIIFIILLIVLLTLNVKIEYFIDVFTTKQYIILKDNNNNPINPVVWYKFDSDNINKDDINPANNLIYNSGSVSKDYIKGNETTGGSLYLGNGTYAKMPINNINLNTINKNNGISFTFWGKFNSSTGSWARIFDFGMQSINIPSYGSRSILIARYATYNNLIFYISSRDQCCPGYEDAGYAIIGNENYFDGQWRNYTWTISKDGIWNIYINGSKVLNNFNANRIIPEFNNNNNKFYNYFGKSLYNHDGYLNGNLDDYRIYDRILTEDQIYELYSGYKKVGETIDTSSTCVANINPSGEISQIPSTNMKITNISAITKITDYMYNQSFGDGTTKYTLTFSKYFNDNYIPTNLFLRNNNQSAFTMDNYDDNGNYKGVFSLPNYPQKGEFIHLKLPSAVILKRYGFKAIEDYVSRAPGTWALYTGTRLLDSTTNAIQLVNNTTVLNNNNYCNNNSFTYIHDISANITSGDELLFIFPSLASSISRNSPGRILHFSELLLFKA